MDSNKRQKLLVRVIRAVALIAILIVMLRWFERSQIYYPSRTMQPVDAASRSLFEDVRFGTSDGVELNGWFFPAKTNSPRAQ